MYATQTHEVAKVMFVISDDKLVIVVDIKTTAGDHGIISIWYD